jgi:hypothetical protein
LYPEQPQGAPMQPPDVSPEQQVPYRPYPPEPTSWSSPQLAPTQPGGYQPMPIPPPAPRSAKVPLLIAAISALGLALIIVGSIGIVRINSVRSDVAKLKSDNAALQKSEDEKAAALKDAFRSADLTGKLARIKDLDRATDEAFKQWGAGAVKFGALSKAIAVCDDAVDEYDWTAAPFPASMFGALPQKIDLTRSETDCGRSFTSRI